MTRRPSETATTPLSAADQEVVAAYARRQREFAPLWRRNALLLGLPGFVVFVVGGPLAHMPPVAVAGFALLAAAVARGAFYLHKYSRCPSCNTIQAPGWQYPYRCCRGCGQRLSRGWRDSMT